MTTLEERVQELERKVADLSEKLEEARSRKKNPWKTFGMFKDDPFHESAMRLGREWREAQTYEKEIAGS